mgnify:CR=1 FL=1
MLNKIVDWDIDTLVFLNNLGSEQFDAFWVTVTQITTWIPLFLLFFILIFRKHSKRESFFMLLAILFTTVAVVIEMGVVKELVARLRPNNTPELNGLIRILKNPNDYSFFSGHASSSFAITTMVVLLIKRKYKWVWVLFLWPILFAYSRIYVGVHFPLDILVGIAVGLLNAMLFFWLYKKITKPYLV